MLPLDACACVEHVTTWRCFVPAFLTLEIHHHPFKCKESSCLGVRSGLAVRLLKMKLIIVRGGSMNYRFSALAVPVFSPFTHL